MKYLTRRAPPANNQQMIKEENSKALFSLIAGRPGITRAQLGRVTRLSPTTVSTLVDELLRQELVEETGAAVTGFAGRRPISLRVRPQGRQIAHFSLSRGGICYTLLGLDHLPLESRFLAHPAEAYGGFAEDAQGDEPDAGDAYMGLIEDMLKASPKCDPGRLLTICLTFPGIYLKESDSFSWSAMRVSIPGEAVRKLERRLSVPIFLGNASMSRAYAEKKRLDSPEKELKDLLYINVCDGLGAGILAGGEFLSGDDNSAGEIGHVTVDWQGRRCICGRQGCVEQYVTQDAICAQVQEALKAAGRAPHAEKGLGWIGRMDGDGDPVVTRVLDNTALMLFSVIYSTVCVTGIKRVVIGGVEELGPGFLKRLLAQAAQNPRNQLTRGLSISYPLAGPGGEAEGIARFYLDYVFCAAACREAAPAEMN